MSAAEYRAWQEYWSESPFGDERADVRAGIVASTIANVHRGRNQPPFKPQDFMPYSKQNYMADEVIEEKITKFMRRYH